MKIYCDFCGSQIETSTDKTCPNCGGYYSTDRELLDEKERVKRLNELDMQKKELELEQLRQKSGNTGSTDSGKISGKTGCLFVFIISLVIFGALFVMFLAYLISDSETERKNGKPAETSALTRSSYSISLDPIDVPEIPEVPEITVQIPEITKLSELPEIKLDKITVEKIEKIEIN